MAAGRDGDASSLSYIPRGDAERGRKVFDYPRTRKVGKIIESGGCCGRVLLYILSREFFDEKRSTARARAPRVCAIIR